MDLPVIDESRARALLETQAGGDLEFYNELVGIQREEEGEVFRELEDSAESGNVEAFHRIAHTLKGTAATFGLPRLQQLAHDIEQQAKYGIPGDAVLLAARLKDEYIQGMEAIDRFRQTL